MSLSLAHGFKLWGDLVVKDRVDALMVWKTFKFTQSFEPQQILWLD